MDNNKILFTELMEDVEANYDPVKIIHWHGKDIEIKKQLNLSEMLSFVSDVIDVCYATDPDSIDNNEDHLIYSPELKSYAFDYMLVSYYTNISFDADLGSSYDFIAHSDIVKQIQNVISEEQYYFLLDAIDLKIDYINQSNIIQMTRDMQTVSDTVNDLRPLITELTEKFNPTEMENFVNILSKIQTDNALKDIAIKTAKSESPEIIELSKVIGGDK